MDNIMNKDFSPEKYKEELKTISRVLCF
jgi:hypothetical protein